MRKPQNNKRFMILGSVFLCGLLSGYYAHVLVTPMLQVPKVSHYCPSPAVVTAHQDHSRAFEENQLHWKMGFRGWEAPKEISFMQALINENNSLICYYEWPNPNEVGTKLWLTVQLSPTANQMVKSIGLHWSAVKDDNKTIFKCTDGMRSCPFGLLPE